MNIKFKELEAVDVALLRPYFGLRSNLTCDSVILDSFLWKEYYNVEFALLDEKAVLMKMYRDGRHMAALPITRMEDMPHYFRLLEQYFNEELGVKCNIMLADLPGIKALQLEPGTHEYYEVADGADYIYDAEKLRTLSGKKYHKKKNHVNAFLKEYEGRYEYRRLCGEAKQDIWRFLDRWEANKGDDAGRHLAGEVIGIHNILNNMEVLATCVSGVYVDGELEAFTIGSYNKVDRMSIVHIEKANPEIRGLYPFINQQFQVHAFPDALLVNREDDLGIPALRKAKESYHPVLMGKKYTLIQK